MKNRVLIYPFILLALPVMGQNVELYAPLLSGRQAKLYYYEGAKADSLQTTIGSSGKAEFTISNGDYKGMATLVVPGAGGAEMVVAEPSIMVKCDSASLNNETVTFSESQENNFLKYIFTTRSRYMQQQAWLKAGEQLFGANLPFVEQLQAEQQKIEASAAALDKKISTSRLYASDYYRLADFMNRLFNAEQKRDGEEGLLICREMEEKLDIASLYTSGQLWGSVLNFYTSLFNHIGGEDKQQLFAGSVLKTLQRLPAPYYEAYLAGIVIETERFGWHQAQSNILSGIHSQFIPSISSLQRALGAYRVKNEQMAPPLIGLDDRTGTYDKTLVVFYDSDCNSCVNEMFRLAVLYPWLEEKGIRIVSVAADVDKRKYEESIRNYPWPDKLCDFKGFEGDNFSNYNVVGTPSFYLVDKENKLSGMFYTVSDLEQGIKN